MANIDKNTPVTFGMLQEAVDAILSGVKSMFKASEKKADSRYYELKSGQTDLQRQLNDLKVDTPTRKEFDNLKQRVDTHHPTH